MTFNGSVYAIPVVSDSNWGTVLSNYFIAISTGTLQKSGGAFTLTADTDFGATFGLKSVYFKSRATNPSATGSLRLGNAELISWRNAANSADLGLTVSAGNLLQFNGSSILFPGLGSIVNADINAAAAIAYSKLALTGAILNADLAGSIAYSKLTLTASIVSGDISGSISVLKGGTGVTSVTTSPTISAWAAWDANKNLSANNLIEGFTSTATAAGTTTLLVGSTYQQIFTGATTQTVVLPVASTLVNGQQFLILNNSSGVVTVQSSGLNTIQAMAANTQMQVTCINTAGGTGTASWNWTYFSVGTVPVSLGGTGLTTGTSGGVPYFSSTSAMTSSAALAQFGVVLGGGAGAAPVTLAPDASTTKVLTSAGLAANPSWQAVPSAPDSSKEISNVGLAATVSANALTIALKQSDGSTNPSSGSAACKIGFRSATAATGGYTQRTATAALSTVISSGSTAGHVSAVAEYLYVYAIDNAGVIELAWSSLLFDEGSLVTTTAEGGAGTATSRVIMYSTAARSNVAFRLLGRLKSTQATAGTWVTAISENSLNPFQTIKKQNQVYVVTGNGHGSTNTKIRRFTTAQVNIGSAITYADSATNGGSFTINEEGNYMINYHDSSSGGASTLGLSVNSSTLTTSIATVSYANGHRADVVSGGVSFVAPCGISLRLIPGDIVRAHTDGNQDNASERCFFNIIKVGS